MHAEIKRDVEKRCEETRRELFLQLLKKANMRGLWIHELGTSRHSASLKLICSFMHKSVNEQISLFVVQLYSYRSSSATTLNSRRFAQTTSLTESQKDLTQFRCAPIQSNLL